MLQITDHEPARKPDDGDRDWVARSVARRFGVSVPTARTICALAGLRGREDRAPSGGRAA